MAQKVLNGNRYQCLLASGNGHAATSRACTKIMAMMDSVLCFYCRKNQAQYIPRGALGPCCGNPYLPQLIQGQSQGCWEQAKKDGWDPFNEDYFEKVWEAKMAPVRKSSENLTLHALDSSITRKVASYIFGRQCTSWTKLHLWSDRYERDNLRELHMLFGYTGRRMSPTGRRVLLQRSHPA